LGQSKAYCQISTGCKKDALLPIYTRRFDHARTVADIQRVMQNLSGYEFHSFPRDWRAQVIVLV